ncbi:hypothetical protein HZH68_012341 [Vespula germanica]|uniref:C2H2-type domain-containing protein n=1 Tax=Vespula germanica TaxID=30212 RepID=A0A834MYG5_VESGE|nr:hypothetical protein HZH68_012341 [Vespula germanica]
MQNLELSTGVSRSDSNERSPDAVIGVSDGNTRYGQTLQLGAYHPCPTCNRTFKRKNSLNKHLLYACGQYPRFKCPYCWYRCKLRSNVYRHVRTSHKKREVYATDVIKNQVYRARMSTTRRNYRNPKGKKFQCPKCPSAFVQKGSLTAHLNYECGQAPRFQCPYCTYRSKQRCTVYRHVRKIHKKYDVYALDIVKKDAYRP